MPRKSSSVAKIIAFPGILIFALFIVVSQVRGEYLWPLQGKVWLNSSFAECRPNHFHAGIDIHAKTGTPLRAIDDGYVWHVAVNPFGYGKSIFMRLTDGRTVVYAHLTVTLLRSSRWWNSSRNGGSPIW